MKKDFFNSDGYAAARINTDSLMPFASKGQTIIFSKNDSIKNGDPVYVALESQRGNVMIYCEDKAKRVKCLLPAGTNNKTQAVNLSKRRPLFMYRITGLQTHYH